MSVKRYVYGVRIESGRGELMEQLRKAHKYRNELCALELQRRQEVHQVVLTNAEYRQAQEKVEEIERQLEATSKELKALRQKARKRVQNKLLSAQVEDLKAELEAAREVAKDAKDAAYADPEIQRQLREITDRYEGVKPPGSKCRRGGLLKEARANCGVYSQTYIEIERACRKFRQGKPPKFKRWTGNGQVSLSFTGGIAAEALFGEAQKLLQLDPNPVKHTYGHRRYPVYRFKFRVGSTGKGNRTPVWVTGTVQFSRPIPEDGQVRQAFLVRRQIGVRERWEMHLVVQSNAEAQLAEGGTVAINFGYRSLPHGLRVAYWVGDDGEEGELVINFPRTEKKADDLRSIRQRSFDQAKEWLSRWLEGNEAPEEFREQLKSLEKWKSPMRLVRLVQEYWANNRFPGDHEIYTDLESWVKDEIHLLDWECFQRRKITNFRTNQFRLFCHELRQRYRFAVLDGTDFSKVTRRPKVEDDDGDSSATRKQAKLASPGKLRDMIVQSQPSVKLAPGNITRDCWNCGSREKFDHAAELVHVCSRCGTAWDQDANACRNLLKRAEELAAQEQEKKEEAVSV